jgi:hypothetical protein
VVNFGELLGPAVTVTASGSYRPADETQRCPKLVLASIERGALNAWGLRIPLPIRCASRLMACSSPNTDPCVPWKLQPQLLPTTCRGQGQVEVGYLDSELRIFRASNGSISLQVRQDRLQALLGWRQ